ncbi:MAG: DUF3127 domain-containing protein [Bacteroidales bacterium]|nr:DUF3127 domain-containing protein [Bacteroidales bacterium]
MEITGKITHILEARQGTSARTGSPWMMQSFVIEAIEPGRQYPTRCVFEVFGEEKLRQFNIQAGETLTVTFDLDAREYQGRWFNSIRAWKVERVQLDPATGMPIPPAAYTPAAPTAVAAPAAAAPAAVAAPVVQGPVAPEPAAEGQGDDLPF